MKKFNQLLKKYPFILIDVGAAGGLMPRLTSTIENIKVIGFEPDERNFNKMIEEGKLKNPNYEILNTALYSEKTKLNLYLTKKSHDSSIYKPNTDVVKLFPNPERYEIVEVQLIETENLNNLLVQNHISLPHFIKLDTQGSELDILKGGSSCLDHVIGIETEIEFIELYENQPLFGDVDTYLRGYNFELWDLRKVFSKRAQGFDLGKKKGQLISGDALYLKKIDSIISQMDNFKDLYEKRCYAINSLLISNAYGLLDYGFKIFNSTKELFSVDEQKELLKGFKKRRYLTINSSFSHHRYHIHLGASKFLDWLRMEIQPYDSVGKVGDLDLGNKIKMG